MTAIDAVAEPSAWSWWEGRRLAYNIALFVTGWIGFALLVAFAFAWDARSLSDIWRDGTTDLLVVTARMGLVYLVYMAAANLLFLIGPLLEVLLKPEPIPAYRRRAWTMGLVVSVGLPLILAVSLGLLMWDPGHGG